MHLHVCVSAGKKCSQFKKIDVLCFLETSVLRFSLLPLSCSILSFLHRSSSHLSILNMMLTKCKHLPVFLIMSKSTLGKWCKKNYFDISGAIKNASLSTIWCCIYGFTQQLQFWWILWIFQSVALLTTRLQYSFFFVNFGTTFHPATLLRTRLQHVCFLVNFSALLPMIWLLLVYLIRFIVH